MTHETECRAEVMSLPREMYENESDGELVIKIRKRSGNPKEFVAKNIERLDEKMKAEGVTSEDVAGAFVVDMTIKVGDLTDDDIIGCDPDVFLKNGLVAAILDEIRYGLSDRRGINISEAVENSGHKANQAKECLRRTGFLDKMMLAMSETKGEA